MVARVSVIIPTYNRADLIAETIQSVLAQDYDDIEILVIDDGSTDNTKEVLSQWIENKQISYYYQQNQGQATARNLGLSIASGDYICFLDSDNVWLPGKIKQQSAFLTANPNIDIVYGDTITIDGQGVEISRKNMQRYSGIIYRQMLYDNCVSMNTTMTRRQCFLDHGGFDTTFRAADDYELWLRFSAHCQYHYLPEFFVKYRVFPNQISSDKERRFLANERAYQKFMSANQEFLTVAEQRLVWAKFYARWSYYRARAGKLSSAISSALRSIQYCPWQRAGWRNLVTAPLLAWRARH